MTTLIFTSRLLASATSSSFFATLAAAFVAFVGFALVLAIPALRGRKLRRTCACAGSKRVLKLLEDRRRAEIDARRYAPEKVDVAKLPIASPELVAWLNESSSRREESDARRSD